MEDCLFENWGLGMFRFKIGVGRNLVWRLDVWDSSLEDRGSGDGSLEDCELGNYSFEDWGVVDGLICLTIKVEMVRWNRGLGDDLLEDWRLVMARLKIGVWELVQLNIGFGVIARLNSGGCGMVWLKIGERRMVCLQIEGWRWFVWILGVWGIL